MSISAIAIPIILDAARRVGAPLIESIMRKALGEAAGGIAGKLAESVIETIAGHAGVDTDTIAGMPSKELEKAVVAAEELTPELILAQVEQQREANRLQLAEMEKESTWSWAWRPATMWLIAAFWLWLAVAVPLINLMLALLGSSERLALGLDIGTLLTLTGIYMGLYMGGHTVKSVWGRT